MPINRILLVGHCGADSYGLRRMLAAAAPDVAIESINDGQALERAASPQTLLLVNRVLDGSFSTHEGVALIAALAQRGDRLRMMLVSNYADAQAAAVAAGALEGFGKSEMSAPATHERSRAALGDDVANAAG